MTNGEAKTNEGMNVSTKGRENDKGDGLKNKKVDKRTHWGGWGWG